MKEEPTPTTLLTLVRWLQAGTRTIRGTGTAVFENGLNMAEQLPRSGCVMANVRY